MIPKELTNMKPLTGDERLERDSEYLGAADFAKGATPVLTIKNIYRGQITLSRGKETKNVITFVEETVDGIGTVRPLIINATNRKTLKDLFGDVSAKVLQGKKIQLSLQPGVRNPAKNEVGEGIRILKVDLSKNSAYVPPKCEECGKDIVGMSNFTPEQLAEGSKKKYGKCLCVECGKKAKAEMEKKAYQEAVKEDSGEDIAAQLTAEADE